MNELVKWKRLTFWVIQGKRISEDLHSSVDHAKAAPIDGHSMFFVKYVYPGPRGCIKYKAIVRFLAGRFRIDVDYEPMSFFVESIDQSLRRCGIVVGKDTVAQFEV